ncbi:ATP-dependent helicase [Roseimaritima sediminicola]|uniref:ATP-dependent helicase n=1 Tax=Roseimaritima sediminicola TaxID=2662066 RepID=UPI0012983895|nr:UvrD-helicase domain-containing protein [Roseimaritima sediminicola]
MADQLTAAQQEAVEHIDGPMLILAGPGSGKTRVVTHRIAHLLDHGIPAYRIAALTFTNKAADEMRVRLGNLAPGQDVWMGTFHRFCARLLRRYASMVGLQENYSIYDTADSKRAMKRAVETAGVSTSHTSPDQIAAVISRAKNRLVGPEMMQGQSLRANETVAAKVYPVYQQQLLTANAVDFDDLLFHVARLLRESPELRAELDGRYQYIMVDEYQDTNLAQYAIVRALSIDYPNLAVTGDPDQSIYGWRGADLNNILDFEKDYPNVKTVRLEKNYRSTPNILRAADQLIRHNTRRKNKRLLTDHEEGAPVVMRMYEDGYREADDIADQIVAAIATEGCRPRDFAVFCRMNALTRSLEHAFRSRGLPYQIVNGVEFYQRKEIKDLLAYLHLINNPAHDVALLRVINVPARGIGAKTIERVRRFADEHRIPLLEAARRVDEIDTLPARSATKVRQFVEMFDRLSVKATAALEDLVLYLLDETGYRKHLEKHSVDEQDNSPLANIDEFVTATVEFDRQHPDDGSLEAFLEQVALVSDTDAWEESNDRVTLMTMHAAKGLEFPRVFIIAVEDDLLPHYRCKEDPMQVEEERRLLFVGITRAEQWLQLSCCKRRAVRGDMKPVVGSPFLMELPREEMRFIEPEESNRFFDAPDEFDYPDSWDLPAADPEPEDDLCQLPPEERLQEAKAKAKPAASIPAALTTAAQLLGGQAETDRVPWTAFKKGMVVTHAEYGDGKIVKLTGRGPKCTATVDFFDGSSRAFRLAFAKLTPVDVDG